MRIFCFSLSISVDFNPLADSYQGSSFSADMLLPFET
jgi:hypothetical protein